MHIAERYKALGGLKPDQEKPGFKNVVLEPHFVKGLNSFQASHTGPYGDILSSWKRNGKTVIYQVTIPANSTASLKLSGKKVSQNGKAISTKTDGSTYLTNLTAGHHEFLIVE